ncbi:unnamed protein product [Paramecium sonneborni]|nr:unnamed protein product [Paramecium sonneborni]
MAVYPQQQGGYPPNQIQNPQYQGQPYQQVYPNQFQGNYPPQSTNIGFNFQPGIILEGDKLCFYCNRPYNLVQQRKIGGQVFLAFLLLLIFFWPLCWLPFVMEDCKDKYYYCSQCGKLIYKRQYTMMS